MSIGLTYSELKKLEPCQGSLRDVAKLMGGARKWGKKRITAKEAIEVGVGFDDLLWVASAVALNDKDVERRLRLFLADCAARVLHLFEKEHPDDAGPREAIIAARQYANGEIRAAAGAAAGAAARAAARAAAGAAARAAAWDAAGAAARAAAWDAARAAARAAAGAAARAAAWDAARDAARAAAWDAAWDAARAAARAAAWAAAWDAARAAAGAAAWDAAWDAARAAERQWQLERLVLWLSDPEPTPIDLPGLPGKEGVAA